MKKAFTLIELLIVITVFGILSVLLFRTMAEMITTNARIQQEKILAQELISIQTSLNSLSEQYPYIDYTKYSDLPDTAQGFVSALHLTNSSGASLTIQGTGDCTESCFLQGTDSSGSFPITNSSLTKIAQVGFKILPIHYYTGTQYMDLELNTISAPGFWIFGNLTNNLKNGRISKVSYTIQHFINLQEKEIEFTEEDSSTNTPVLQQAQEIIDEFNNNNSSFSLEQAFLP